MPIVFEWDKNKDKINQQKHGVSFDEAQSVFIDELSVMKPDADHSITEKRLLIIGKSNNNRIIIASYTERGEKIRLINVRKATRKERIQYEEEYF